VSDRIHAVDVIGGTLFAAAVTLLIALGLCDMFNVALPGPLMRLHGHGLLGLMIAALFIMAAIVLWGVGLMSPPGPNGETVRAHAASSPSITAPPRHAADYEPTRSTLSRRPSFARVDEATR